MCTRIYVCMYAFAGRTSQTFLGLRSTARRRNPCGRISYFLRSRRTFSRPLSRLFGIILGESFLPLRNGPYRPRISHDDKSKIDSLRGFGIETRPPRPTAFPFPFFLLVVGSKSECRYSGVIRFERGNPAAVPNRRTRPAALGSVPNNATHRATCEKEKRGERRSVRGRSLLTRLASFVLRI